jgi:hypothetical protein
MAAHLFERTIPVEMQDRIRELMRDAAPTISHEAGGERPGTLGEPRRDMHPNVAAALGIDPSRAATQKEVTVLFLGRKADGTDLPGHRRQVSYIDLCFSADKSVSVAWAFAGTDAERASILQAHRDAVDSTMQAIEGVIGQAKRGRGEAREPGRIGWLTFDHFTSRPTVELIRADPVTGKPYTELVPVEDRQGRVAGDPNLHTHVAVLNVVVTDSGHVGSLDRNAIAGRFHEFGALYQAFIGENLRRIGADVGLGKHGQAVLTAIPEWVREEFSKRTKDAHAAARAFAARHGLGWDGLTDEGRFRLLKGGARETRLPGGDDLANEVEWKRQAQAIGWEHRTVMTFGPPMPQRDRAERLERAFQTFLGLYEQELARRGVHEGASPRTAAARALVVAGIEEAADVDAITRAARERGVRQDGRRTDLIWGRDPGQGGAFRVTTALHVEQEEEVVRLARTAAADRRGALPKLVVEAKARASGLDFSGEHGKAQRAAMDRAGTGGRLTVIIGPAGFGKNIVVAPLVPAWRARGDRVMGVAVAWRQANALVEAGIDKKDTRALDPFLRGVKFGWIKPDARTVVVLDEVGLVSGRQMLALLRVQERTGMKIVAMGDDRQASSIEAGPVIELLRRALGAEQVPEVLTTRRQQTEREREIAGLFREGRADEALAMKREDGTALVVPGGKREAVRRVADLWAERVAAVEAQGASTPKVGAAGALRRLGPGGTVTVTAPTNADAREVSAAIREIRQAKGEVGPTLGTLKAVDQAGAEYAMPVGIGDRVRLFGRTWGQDGTKRVLAGVNGSVVTVEGIDKERGLLLRTAAGRSAFVGWDALADKATGRIRLAPGDVLTIDAAQGMTSTEHIDALVSGSRGMSQGKAYVAESRHRVRAWLVTSDGAERKDVAQRRLLTDAGKPISAEDVWANIARNLGREARKGSALGFVERAAELRQGAERTVRAAVARFEARLSVGLPPTVLPERRELAQARAALEGLAERLDRQGQTLEGVDRPSESPPRQPIDRVALRAGLEVVRGKMDFSEAVEMVVAAELGRMAQGASVDPVHRIARAGLTDNGLARIEERAEERVLVAVDAWDAKMADRQERAARAREDSHAAMPPPRSAGRSQGMSLGR